MERTLPKYALQFYHCWLYWSFKIILSSIGFEWKKSVDLLVSGFFLCCNLSVRLFHQRVRGFASNQCKFHFNPMYGGLDMSYGSKAWKLIMKDPWMSESLENDRWWSGSIVYPFSINWGGSKWIPIVNFTLWHDLCLKHCHPLFLRIVFHHKFWQLLVTLLSF